MPEAYRCPNCKTNRSRFNVIEQVPHYVRIDPDTGEWIAEYEDESELVSYHLAYNGPNVRVQCAVCGLLAEEEMFIKRAQKQKPF